MGLLVVEIAVVAVVCFLIGSVNPAALVGRALGRDLRTSGSGNPGATNAGRVLGPKWGVLVLVLDVAKAYLPTLLVLRTLGTVPALVAGLSVVLGHVFSPFLRGHGGKGAACALGAVLAVEPWVGLGAVVAFALAKTVLPFVGEASVVTVGVIGARRGVRSGRAGAARGAGRRGLAGAALRARPVPPPPQHRRLAVAAGAVTAAVPRACPQATRDGPAPTRGTRRPSLRRPGVHRRSGLRGPPQVAAAPRGGRSALLSVGVCRDVTTPSSSPPGHGSAPCAAGLRADRGRAASATRGSPRPASNGSRSSRHASRLSRWGWVYGCPSRWRGRDGSPAGRAVLGVVVVTLLAVAVFGLRVAWASSDDGGRVVAPGGGSRAGPTGVTAGAAPVGVTADAAARGIAGTGGAATSGAGMVARGGAPTVTGTPGAVVVVHVVGQVRRPGVLRLAAGSRVADALDAAGGPTPER